MAHHLLIAATPDDRSAALLAKAGRARRVERPCATPIERVRVLVFSTPLLLGPRALGQPLGGGGISRRQSRVTSSMS